ncbi:MAG: glycosyltransferase family 4 protein [Hyphomicrobium zavarzinii]|uniref:glycosyltransferase family 4 protein n=1 Tax=Hyphomicrobium zavarzinii TaxID=48292 RepID=UPI001A367371|nr:glycosyltransferase family 4 protein [Hyphomicrobium zavarzinii]MBL8847985.1 glycosyltransferase family 4 protein [Hyphomicrobium zavarzinii]
MKHVWILNHYALEPGGAGGTRHFSLAKHLPAHGWKATILAASTEHGTGRQRLADGEAKKIERIGEVSFLWLRTGGYSGNGADRIRNMLDYTRAVLARENLAGLAPPDAIIGSSVHPLAAWAGRKLARRYGVPFIFEVRDLWPQTLIDMGRISSTHPAAFALRWLERSLYRSAKRIIVLLPKAGDYIEPLGIPSERIVWIPNGVDLDQFPSPVPPTASQSFTLMYLGAHGGANGLDNLLAAMRIVQADPRGRNVALRLIGHGPLKPSLMAMAKDLALGNVIFEDPVAKSEIPARAAQADAFVICVRDLPLLYRFGVSMNKIFDYMAAGRPTIISIDAANNPIAEAGAGFTVPPENPEALAAAILEMASLAPERRAEMGQRARDHLEANYDMSLLAKRLASALDECGRAA